MFAVFQSQEVRPDGRELLQFRPVSVNIGTVTTAEGSAIARVGNTTVVCGIKAVSMSLDTGLLQTGNYSLQ